ncbi:MAG: class I tRNA ligase family protein, partial [Planctomycetales bacterium]|nr:class I tRNA ligase family protein [Planctomycetales bacterium]
RYWGKAKAAESRDKSDAYWTLYEVLLELSKLVAPFVPFVAESMWQTLTESVRERVRTSVHLCDYPTVASQRCDSLLSERMRVLREVASLGRSARMDAKLKVRQPLASVEVSLASNIHMAWLTEHDQIIREELNVKQIAYNAGNSPYIEYQILPNFKLLGPRVGNQLPSLKKRLASLDGARLLAELQSQGFVDIELGEQTLRLAGDELEVRLKAKSGWAAAQGRECVVVLSTDLTPELIREGMARDLVRLIQDLRKQRDCQFTDRIRVYAEFENAELTLAIEENHATIAGETLATEILFSAPTNQIEKQSFEISGHTLQLGIETLTAVTNSGGQA